MHAVALLRRINPVNCGPRRATARRQYIGIGSHRRPRRQHSRITNPPDKCMKRSDSLDLFIYLLGRALAPEVTSGAHPATPNTDCVNSVRGPTMDSGVTILCVAQMEPQLKWQASATSGWLPKTISVEGFAWQGVIPSLDETVHAASTREKLGHQRFMCMKSRRLDIWQYLPEDHSLSRFH